MIGSASLLTNRDGCRELAKKGISAEVFESGKRTVGRVEITAFDAPQEPVLGEEPPQNTAYLLDGVFLNPGDSFADNFAGLTR